MVEMEKKKAFNQPALSQIPAFRADGGEISFLQKVSGQFLASAPKKFSAPAPALRFIIFSSSSGSGSELLEKKLQLRLGAGAGAGAVPKTGDLLEDIRFDISNTEHVKQVRLLDRVTILCPHPIPGQPYEYSKLYVVSREGYDKCQLLEEKQLGDFSPLPSGLQFQTGQSYYVITTSDGTQFGLNGTSNGLCLTRNMKMKFDVSNGSSKNHRLRTTVRPDSNSALSFPQTALPDAASPMLYIIHTSEPETAASVNDNSMFGEHGVIEDDSDACFTNLPNRMLLAAGLIIVDLSWRRILSLLV
uniref:Ephrin RBD domain-containing protein n=1 Tax=Ditylenchus dipsaci TaxID=166011 RepID=A0A915D4E9_9BILA